MTEIRRSEENPILIPLSENTWEADRAFNGCPVRDGGKIHFVYRAISPPQKIAGRELTLSTVGYALSNDGIHFRNRRQFIKPEHDWEQFGCEDPRVTKMDGKFYVFYTALSTFPFCAECIRVGVAITRDFKKIDEKHPVTPFNAKAMSLFPEKIMGRYAVVLTANTDIPPSKIAVAYFDREEQMWSPTYWKDWYSLLNKNTIPLQRSPKDHVEAGAPPIKTKYGWLLIYSYIQNYCAPPAVFGVEAALLDLHDPRKIIARTDKPLLVPQEEYEKHGKVPNIVFPTGAMVKDGTLYLYYGAADTACAVATCKIDTLMDEMMEAKIRHVRLTRFTSNPVIKPNPKLSWQSKAAFNPTVLYEDGRVHLAYRAMSEDNTSVIGFASSVDGSNFDDQSTEPMYVPREDFEAKLIPGGNSGCEDPRLTRIDDTIYMLYTAFNGRSDPRVALTQISLDDFLTRRWNWSRPVLISPPNLSDKDAAIFPKKIKGKYAVLHRLGTSIWLDLVNDLKFEGNKWLGGHIFMSPKDELPDTDKLGISGPPIETKYGWLLLYHAVSRKTQPMTYYVAAALLDMNDPSKVIARRKVPILEPETPYELYGQVNNVVFPCGAAIIGEDLFVYYGGADSVIGVATMKVEDLLISLLTWGEIGNDVIKLGKFKWGTFSFSHFRN
jgi:beta-1,2-mannobiose phosphorylase / 1,2-beta-oligomannan phosphorylase